MEDIMKDIMSEMYIVYMCNIINNSQYSSPRIIDDIDGIDESDYQYNNGVLFDNTTCVIDTPISITYSKWNNIIENYICYSTPILRIDN
jgi:hypothetical protein